MAVMYPYFTSMYSHVRRRGSDMSEFSESNPKYFVCRKCCHVASITLFLNGITILLCLVSIAFTTAGIVLEDSHKYMNSRHINLEYASHQHKFTLFYHVTLGVLLAGSCVHLLTAILCVCGVKYVRQNLIIPELIVTGLFVGLVLFATISTVICMIIILGFMWSLTVTVTVMVLYASCYFYVLILTYRYTFDKRRSWSVGTTRNGPGSWGKMVEFVE